MSARTQNVLNATQEAQKALNMNNNNKANVVRALPLANFAKHKPDTYDLEIDLAGVDKNDIEVKVEDDYLTVNAMRQTKEGVKEEDYYVSEGHFGTIFRKFLLPKDVNREKVQAKYEDGRLYICLEKEEERKARRIEIK